MSRQRSSHEVTIRLLAAAVALAAGVAAVVIAILFARTTLREAGAASSSAAGPARIGSTEDTGTPRFPSPPADALALGRESGDLAVGLAVRQRGQRLALQASVIGPAGAANGLSVAFRPAGSSADPVLGTPCGPGCYRAAIPASATRAVRLDLSGSGRRAATLVFPLPASVPGPPAADLVRRADSAWRSLKTLVVHDRLSSGPGATITTLWRYQAPDRLSYRIKGNAEAIIVGDRRWDRVGGGAWQESRLDPLVQPVPLWLRVSNAHLLGTERKRGRTAWKIAFFDPEIHGWFTIWVDRTSMRTLELRMTAQSHFMHEVYGPFDAPFVIAPPTTGAR